MVAVYMGCCWDMLLEEGFPNKSDETIVHVSEPLYLTGFPILFIWIFINPDALTTIVEEAVLIWKELIVDERIGEIVVLAERIKSLGRERVIMRFTEESVIND